MRWSLMLPLILLACGAHDRSLPPPYDVLVEEPTSERQVEELEETAWEIHWFWRGEFLGAPTRRVLFVIHKDSKDLFDCFIRTKGSTLLKEENDSYVSWIKVDHVNQRTELHLTPGILNVPDDIGRAYFAIQGARFGQAVESAWLNIVAGLWVSRFKP